MKNETCKMLGGRNTKEILKREGERIDMAEPKEIVLAMVNSIKVL